MVVQISFLLLHIWICTYVYIYSDAFFSGKLSSRLKRLYIYIWWGGGGWWWWYDMIWYEYDNNHDALHKLNFLQLVKWFCAYFSNHILFILYLLFVFTFLGCWVGFGGWWKQVWKSVNQTHAYTCSMDREK